MAPKTLFEVFGHKCDLTGMQSQRKRPSKMNLCRRIKYTFDRVRIINETNKRGYNFLRSQKKISMEQEKQLQYPYVIHPFSIFRKYWEILMIITLLTQFVVIPLDAAIDLLEFPDIAFYLDTMHVARATTCVISMVDVVVNFFTGYCDNKRMTVELNISKITHRYLVTTFALDVYASLTMDRIIRIFDIEIQGKNNFYFYFELIAVMRYVTFIKYSCNFFENIENFHFFSRIILAVISFMIYLHLICCTNMLWGIYQTNWQMELSNYSYIINSYGPEVDCFAVYYVRSLYTTSMVILNSGFLGYANGIASRAFNTLIWMTSRFLYIICIAFFMSLHAASASSHQKYADMVTEVQGYMRHRQVPIFLQRRIVAYYDIKFKSCYYEESEILGTISGQLKQEIELNACRKMVQSVTFFKNIPVSLLMRIVSCLRFDIFLTNDVVIKSGTFGECMYFISSGTVAVYTKSGKEITHLQDGDYFGEISLMLNTIRVATVVASDVCELYRLDKKDFSKCILPYPDLYNTLQHVASERKEEIEIIEEIFKAQQTVYI